MYSTWPSAPTDTISARDFTGDPAMSAGTQPTTVTGSPGQDPSLQDVSPVAPHPGGNPATYVLVLLGILALSAWIVESQKEEIRNLFSEVKISVWNVFVVTLLAIPGFVVSKTLVTKYLAANNPVRKMVLAA